MDTMIELPALRRSAELAPNSVDNDARTEEVVWSAGARVCRAGFKSYPVLSRRSQSVPAFPLGMG